MINNLSLSWLKGTTWGFQLRKSQADKDKFVAQGRGRGWQHNFFLTWLLDRKEFFFPFQSIWENICSLKKGSEGDITSRACKKFNKQNLIQNVKYQRILGESIERPNGLIMFRTFNLQLCLVYANWSGISHKKKKKTPYPGCQDGIPTVLSWLNSSYTTPLLWLKLRIVTVVFCMAFSGHQMWVSWKQTTAA